MTRSTTPQTVATTSPLNSVVPCPLNFTRKSELPRSTFKQRLQLIENPKLKFTTVSILGGDERWLLEKAVFVVNRDGIGDDNRSIRIGF